MRKTYLDDDYRNADRLMRRFQSFTLR